MLRALVAHSVLLVLAAAQDTQYCPDGWDVVQGRDPNAIECVLLGGLEERVTKSDAELICAGHGGWVVDMDEGHGPAKNNAIKKLISDKQGQNNVGPPGYNFQDQWWIGATCDGPHGDHNQETGSGTIPTPPSNGMIGMTTSPMTGTIKIALPSSRTRIFSDLECTTGTTGHATMSPELFAKEPQWSSTFNDHHIENKVNVTLKKEVIFVYIDFETMYNKEKFSYTK